MNGGERDKGEEQRWRNEKREMRNNTEKGSLAADGSSGFIGERLLVPFVGRKADGHLRHNACYNGPEALVKPQRRFSFYNLSCCSKKPTAVYLFSCQMQLQSDGEGDEAHSWGTRSP